MLYVGILLSFMLGLNYTSALPVQPQSRLLLILLDGFRWDYLQNLTANGGFDRFLKNGVQAEYMDPLYPSESFPGYYAITTGLYGETNGIPLNYMYNETSNIFFKMMPDAGTNHSFWWEVAEPLWVTATRNDIDTASLLWPGGHIPINGILPKFYTEYRREPNPLIFQTDLKRAIDMFTKNEIQYAQVYCEFPDLLGHAIGPEAFRHYFFRFLDEIIATMLDDVQKNGLDDSLNIVILSDHGMTATDVIHAKTIELDHVLDLEDVKLVLDRGSHVGIYPNLGKDEKVYNDLKRLPGVNVYKREEIPERFHLKNSIRVPPIFVEVKKGYFLIGLKNDEKQIPRDVLDWQWLGFHGYDAAEMDDMRGIFIAKGPAFKKGVTTPPVHIVDPYNVLSVLLGMDPKENNGTWANVKNMLDKF